MAEKHVKASFEDPSRQLTPTASSPSDVETSRIMGHKEKIANLFNSSLALLPLIFHFVMPFEISWLFVGRYIQTRSDQILFYATIVGVVLLRQPIWRPRTWTPGLFGYYFSLLFCIAAVYYWYDYYAPEVMQGQVRGTILASAGGPAVAHSMLIRQAIEARPTFRKHGKMLFFVGLQGLCVAVFFIYIFGPRLSSFTDWDVKRHRTHLRGNEIAAPGELVVIFGSWRTMVILNAATSAILPLGSPCLPWRCLLLRIDQTFYIDVVPSFLSGSPDRLEPEDEQDDKGFTQKHEILANAVTPPKKRFAFILNTSATFFFFMLSPFLIEKVWKTVISL